MILLFDIDGTLVNTDHRFMQRIVKQSIKAAGYDVHDTADSFAGRTDLDIFNSLTNHPEPVIEQTSRHYFSHLDQELKASHVKRIEGVLECLQTFKDDEVHLALLTGNFKNSAYLKLDRANLCGYFNWDISAFGQDGIHRNELSIAALKRIKRAIHTFEADKDFVFVIGDTPRDIECARSAGFISVAISTGSYSSTELQQFDPDISISNLKELKKEIEQYTIRYESNSR